MDLERRDLLRYGSISALVTASGCLGLIGGGDDDDGSETGDGNDGGNGDSSSEDGSDEDEPEETETGPPAQVLSQRISELTAFLDFVAGPARGARSGYVRNLEKAGQALQQLDEADPSSITEDEIAAVGTHLDAAATSRDKLKPYYTEHYAVEQTGDDFVSEATSAINRQDYSSFEEIISDYKSVVAALQQSPVIGANKYYPMPIVHRSQYELLLNSAIGNIELSGSTDLSYDRIGEVYHRGPQGRFAGYLTPVDLPVDSEPFNRNPYDYFDEEQEYEYEGDTESKLTVDAGEDDDEDDDLENPVFPFVYRDVFAVDEARVSETLLSIIHCNFVNWSGADYPDGFLREVELEGDRPDDVRPDNSTPMNTDEVSRKQRSLAYIQRYESGEAAAAAFESLQEAVGVGNESQQRGGFTWTRLYATESAADETLYADGAQIGEYVLLTELLPDSWRDREAVDQTEDEADDDTDADDDREMPREDLLEGTLFDLTDLTEDSSEDGGDS